MLTAGEADGVVIDWVVSQACGADFIEEIQSRYQPFAPPVVVFGPPQLDAARGAELHRLSRISSVRYAPTLERLLDETVLLLHRPEEALSASQRRSLAEARQVDPVLAGRKILVVDDDLRNIFALTSVLEQHEISVLHAETGRGGIEALQDNPDVDLILMDIMMPEMDGYETTRAIRRMPGFAALPIIALTAKAMKGDREKCLQAGASDYVTKPVDLAYLFSVMRVWLSGLRGAREGSMARVV
jgi:CheY-like chemotaxis protein